MEKVEIEISQYGVNPVFVPVIIKKENIEIKTVFNNNVNSFDLKITFLKNNIKNIFEYKFDIKLKEAAKMSLNLLDFI